MSEQWDWNNPPKFDNFDETDNPPVTDGPLKLTFVVSIGQVLPHHGTHVEVVGSCLDNPEQPMVRIVGTTIHFALTGPVVLDLPL